MNARDLPPDVADPAACDASVPGATTGHAAAGADAASDLLAPLLRGAAAASGTGAAPDAALRGAGTPAPAPPGVVIGELLAIEDGTVALVRHPQHASPQALRAPSTVDLHGALIGASVVLAFDGGDLARPVVIGVLQGSARWPLPQPPAQVEVDADGQRLVVHAREQLVLRCGKASITLTRAGKVLIEGSYVLSRSSGVNRIKGGSVQLN